MTGNYTHEELAKRVASIHHRSRQLAHKRHQSGLQDHGILGLSTSLKELAEYLEQYKKIHERES